MLFGKDARDLVPLVGAHPPLVLVEDNPEVVVCYGGDGTLLTAELQWPGVPKVPIRNSRRGNKCIPHTPQAVLDRLAAQSLHRTEFAKLECALCQKGHDEPTCYLTAMNEFNVHMGRINSSVRYMIWVDDEPYRPSRYDTEDHEIIGDGFIISTPFGSTAYFNQITRGVFRVGMGIAFKFTSEQANHLVVDDNCVIRVLITRGPAVVAFDNAPDYFELNEGDELLVRKHPKKAIILTWHEMKYPSDTF